MVRAAAIAPLTQTSACLLLRGSSYFKIYTRGSNSTNYTIVGELNVI
jgi:hypothetical protein